MYTPSTDMLFTPVFVLANSFTASVTCVNMIFLPTDASFVSLINTTNTHQYDGLFA